MKKSNSNKNILTSFKSIPISLINQRLSTETNPISNSYSNHNHLNFLVNLSDLIKYEQSLLFN